MRIRRACKPTRNQPSKPMSYILDALKRADAERERGAVPGLHARQLTTSATPSAYGTKNRIWLAMGATLALAGMAAGLWIWKAPDSALRLAAVDPVVASAPASAPIPALPLPQQPAVVVQQAAQLPQPALVLAAPKLAPKQALAVAKPSPPKPKADPVARAASAPAALPAVQLLGDLSENIRRQIPPLAITGSVYSDNPGKRLLLVNNQVLPQGSLAAPEVKLEEIQAKSSVFSFRGTRFRVAH